jgi:hypothetical protein
LLAYREYFSRKNRREQNISSYPSEKSACKRLKYVSHLFPITFPQEKHRTGIIIVAIDEKRGKFGSFLGCNKDSLGRNQDLWNWTRSRHGRGAEVENREQAEVVWVEFAGWAARNRLSFVRLPFYGQSHSKIAM